MRAAARALRAREPARIVVAVPASAPDACNAATLGVDEVVCAATPQPFHAVGRWYENFSQTSDGEVRELLERARARAGARGPAPPVSRS
jgi:putative phosphoribosyl transferase